jgi:hypothetical protein
MATTNVQQARIPTGLEIPVINLTGTDIGANVAVRLDGSNKMTNSLTSATGIAIALPATGGNPSPCIGLTVETIKNGLTGRVAGPGQIGLGVCDGAVTQGDSVDASAAVAGRIKAHTAAKFSLGLALTDGADGDTIPVLVGGAPPNA